MRILPDLKWLYHKDYKTKYTAEQVLSALRSRYQSATIRSGHTRWKFDNMPNKYIKMSLGNHKGFWVPRYEWDKLKYRFGKMSKGK